MKIALIMSGQTRTLEECLPSFREYIWEPLTRGGVHEVRLFCHTPADAKAHLAYSLSEFGVDPVIEIEPQPGFDECNYILRSGKGVCGVQSVLAQFWGWTRSLQLASAWGWDFAVRLRPDTLYYNAIESPDGWKSGTFYAPRFASFWGLCDRFGYGDREIMTRWLALGEKLDDYLAEGHAFHPESLLARAIQPCTLARTDVLFSTVREGGNIRPPQFLKEIGDEPKCA